MYFEGTDKTDYKSVIRASGLQIRKSGGGEPKVHQFNKLLYESIAVLKWNR